MGTIKDKANYLLDTKVILRSALIAAGAEVDENTPFREYANYITGLVPSGTALDLELMQAQNYMNTHMYGGDILTLAALEQVRNQCQEYIQIHIQEDINE